MNVLMLTDFSSNARHSHRYALELYKEENITSFLLHVKKPCLNSAKCSGKCKLGLHQKLIHDAKDLINSENQTTPKAILTEGSFIEAVRSTVIKHNIDVLVIGAKGKSAEDQQAIGRNTHAIATKVKCPVLIVFENSPIRIPQSVLFPVNYTDALYPVCLNKLQTLPNWKELSINILELKPLTAAQHILLGSKQILEDSLKAHSVEFITSASPDMQLTHEAKNYNLMVFAAKNLSVGNQIFSELRKNKEAFHFQTPLFVLHA